jgi:hypothetical protein
VGARTHQHTALRHSTWESRLNVKNVSIAGRGAPLGYETSRLSHFLDGGEVVSFTLPPAAIYAQ